MNRVLSPKRKDFAEYLSRLVLDAGHADPIEVLGGADGERETDKPEVFPKFRKDSSGGFHVRFFLHGLRYLGAVARERMARLQTGEPFGISVELNNPATRPAIPPHTDDFVIVGCAPRYPVENLIATAPHAPHLEARVWPGSMIPTPPSISVFSSITLGESPTTLSR